MIENVNIDLIIIETMIKNHKFIDIYQEKKV